MITIKSQVDGFRRCGVAHPAAETEYPDDRFSPEELVVLMSEPMLTVTMSTRSRLDDASREADAMAMTVSQLTERLAARQVSIPPGAKKADLVALFLADQAQANSNS